MSKFYITHKCGHKAVLDLGGPTKDRQRIADYRASQLCSDCYKAEQEARKQQINMESAQKAQEQGLPELLGSEKQVAYAETCRREVLDKLEVLIRNADKHIPSMEGDKKEELMKIKNMISDVKKFISNTKKEAGWWIDTKKELTSVQQIRMFCERVQLEIERNESKVEQTPKNDTTSIVRPDATKTETVAKIRVVDNVVEVHFAERNDELREVVKGLQYKWESGRWVRKLIARNGTPVDRAAEVAHYLLASGFIVSADQNILDKAATADYDKEHTRWISTVREDHEKYPSYFYILWDRQDDYYHAAMRINGSKYLKPGVVVDPRHHELVQDFAKMYDFKFTQAALDLIDRSISQKAAEMTVEIAPLQKEIPFVAPLKPDKLEISGEVEIDEEFRDDD